MNDDIEVQIIEAGEFALNYEPRKRSKLEEADSELAADDMKRQQPFDDSGDDSYDCCPICFEAWTTGGLHRICSLRCGHVFGKSCIETWLSNGARAKCPQCNSPATKKDIRILFVKRLTAVDTTEKDSLMRLLEEERLLRRRAIESEMKISLAYNAALVELERLQRENEELRTKAPALSLGRIKFSKSITFDPCISARTIEYDSYLRLYILSATRSTSAHKLHGIMKINADENYRSEFVALHDQPIKSISCSPFSDGLLLTTSFDKTLKLSSMYNNTIVLSYDLEALGWSCAFSRDRNIVFVGLGNGKIVVYDLRNTRSHLAIHQVVTAPIHSILTADDHSLIIGTLLGPSKLIISTDYSSFELIDPAKSYGNQCGLLRKSLDSKLVAFSCRGNPSMHYVLTCSGNVWEEAAEVAGLHPVSNLIRPAICPNLQPCQNFLLYTDGPDGMIMEDCDLKAANCIRLSRNNGGSLLDSSLEWTREGRLTVGLLSERQLCFFSS